MGEIEEKISPAEVRFEKFRKTIGLFSGPIVFVIFLLLPMSGLSKNAHFLSAILGWVVIWWVTEPVPIPVTALLGTTLCVIMGVDTMKKIFAPFADPIIFLFIGSFIIARAMMVHRLDRRFAFQILSIPGIGKSSNLILFTLGLIAVLISMWVSNTATTAMLYPIGLGILNTIAQLHSRDVKKLKYSTGLMLIIAYGASVGGIGTPVGTPPNLIGIGLIKELLGKNITFFRWMLFAVPVVVIMYVVLFLLLRLLFPPEFDELSGIDEYVAKEKRAMGKISRGERNVLIAFLITVFLWVFPGVLAIIFGSDAQICKWWEVHIPEGLAAIIGAVILFILPLNWKERKGTITWKEAVDIDWGTILLFGGGLSLGSLMFSTGLAENIGKGILNLTGAKSLFSITAISIILAIITSELTSNTASAYMVIPIMISLSAAANINPLIPALGACLGASYGFMLPVSTAPNAIIYGSGYVPITRMIKTGIIFDFLGFLIILIGVFLLLPLLG
ncbi:MAG: DASS family sodium-coupled anion symporter [candidate division WOR-3 bacterium]|nr:DASS family sodium-coupled anion symporter [candidate division WOR-3 bacterium]